MREDIHEHAHDHTHGPGRGAWEGRAHGPERGFGHSPRYGFGPFGHAGHGGHGGHNWRNRWHGRGGDRDWRGFFGGEGNPWWEGQQWGSWFGGGPGGGRERLERGTLRYIIMDVLKDGPKHGYEIIKQLEERTQGIYSPSPGTLYPTLQLLEDQGIVRSDQESDRRVYHLTDSGHAELDKNAALVEGFWARFRERTPSGPNLHEMKFAGDALKDLLRTVGGGMRNAVLSGDPDTVRKIRLALERCQNEIREIIAQGATGSTTPERGRENPGE
jgi:DNA-binding PadR family transcriptional regulator